jgi:hypothetical protein
VEELDIQDQIGGGGFALVHRGTWRGTPVAIKTRFDPQLSEAQQQEFRCGGGGGWRRLAVGRARRAPRGGAAAAVCILSRT